MKREIPENALITRSRLTASAGAGEKHIGTMSQPQIERQHEKQSMKAATLIRGEKRHHD